MTRTRVILLTLCIAAFALRLGAIVKLHSWTHPDAMEHRSIAYSLVTNGCFCFRDFDRTQPSSYQSPPYPLLLAGFFEIFGPDSPRAFLAAMILNAGIGAITVWLTFWLARAIGARDGVALLASAAVAVWPTQIYACTVAQAVVLITAAVTAIIPLFYVSLRGGRLWPWIGFSVIGCIAALTEPAFLPAMVISGIIVLFARRLAPGTRVRNAAVLFLTALCILGPWTIRNYRVHGALVPVKSSFWVNTWKGNNDLASGTDRISLSAADRAKLNPLSLTQDARGVDGRHAYDALSAADRARLDGRSEIEREKIFKQLTVDWIRAHPAHYARLCWIRLRKTIWIDWENPKSYNIVYVASRAFLLATAFIGLLLAIRRRWSLGFPALLCATTLALYTLTITAARFAIPFEPLMLCLSALAIADFASLFRSSDRRARAEVSGKL